MSGQPDNPYGAPRGEGQQGPLDQPWQQPTPPPIPQYVPPEAPYGQMPQQGQQSPWTQPQQPLRQQPQWSQPQWSQPQDQMPGVPQPQLRYADWGERVGASIIDYGLLVLLTLVLSPVAALSSSLEDLTGWMWFAAAVYLAWLNGSKGQSPGKALMGLKLVRDSDGTTLGGPVGLVRALALWIISAFSLGLFFVLAVLWPLWDPKSQALHDKIVGASVISGHPRQTFGSQIFKP